MIFAIGKSKDYVHPLSVTDDLKFKLIIGNEIKDNKVVVKFFSDDEYTHYEELAELDLVSPSLHQKYSLMLIADFLEALPLDKTIPFLRGFISSTCYALRGKHPSLFIQFLNFYSSLLGLSRSNTAHIAIRCYQIGGFYAKDMPLYLTPPPQVHLVPKASCHGAQKRRKAKFEAVRLQVGHTHERKQYFVLLH